MLLLYRWETLALFGIVVFVLRPIGVFISSTNSGLSFNEKLFISWVGPRGIVAAGIASLFGLKLSMQGEPDAEYITPLVFMIVLGTVLLNATTARLFAKITGVFLKSSEGIIIIGGSNFARLIADYLMKNGRRVVIIDNNSENVKRAKLLGLEAIKGNVYEDELLEDVELNDIGYLLALTSNPNLNEYVIEKYNKVFGEHGAFRIVSTEEISLGKQTEKTHLFTHKDDFINLSEVVRDFPFVNEVTVNSSEHYNSLLKEISYETHAIPVFLKDESGFIHIISSIDKSFKIEKGNTLVYIGKKIV